MSGQDEEQVNTPKDDSLACFEYINVDSPSSAEQSPFTSSAKTVFPNNGEILAEVPPEDGLSLAFREIFSSGSPNLSNDHEEQKANAAASSNFPVDQSEIPASLEFCLGAGVDFLPAAESYDDLISGLVVEILSTLEPEPEPENPSGQIENIIFPYPGCVELIEPASWIDPAADEAFAYRARKVTFFFVKKCVNQLLELLLFFLLARSRGVQALRSRSSGNPNTGKFSQPLCGVGRLQQIACF